MALSLTTAKARGLDVLRIVLGRARKT